MTTATPTGITDLGTILGVWAHPDDEAFLMAGTAMLALEAGSTVACVTATAGEAGETADEARWPQNRLGEIRLREMDDSLAVLGIEDHEWLHLPDGGLDAIDDAVGSALIGDAIRRVEPDTILTFGDDGMTGHPDHVAVGRWAVTAAERSDLEIRVLAATKVQAWYDAHPEVTEAVFPHGGPSTAADQVALTIAASGHVLDRKLQALRTQASQTAGLEDLLGDAVMRAGSVDEYWVRR